MLKLKPGVKPDETWAILVALQVADGVFASKGYDCTVTSLMDGTHGEHSLHTRDGLCRAVDLRTKHLQRKDLLPIVQAIKAGLTTDYDVVLESVGTELEHLHLEFDHRDIKERGGYASEQQQ